MLLVTTNIAQLSLRSIGLWLSRGANELNNEFQGVRCRRAPEFDQYATARKVPWRVLIEEHGWSQECGFCYKRVHAENDVRCYSEYDQAYCDSECLRKATDPK